MANPQGWTEKSLVKMPKSLLRLPKTLVRFRNSLAQMAKTLWKTPPSLVRSPTSLEPAASTLMIIGPPGHQSPKVQPSRPALTVGSMPQPARRVRPSVRLYPRVEATRDVFGSKPQPEGLQPVRRSVSTCGFRQPSATGGPSVIRVIWELGGRYAPNVMQAVCFFRCLRSAHFHDPSGWSNQLLRLGEDCSLRS